MIYPARAPKGLRADSASAVTGRWCPHSVRRFFFFFTEMIVTRKREVEKSIWRLEMDRIYEEYKPAIDKIWGPKATKRIFGPKTVFLSRKKTSS